MSNKGTRESDSPERPPPLTVNQELIDEIARRATARYFDLGIDPSYLKCLGQPEVDEKPAGKMLNCIRQAFAGYARDPRHVQGLEHPDIPPGPYCYTTVGRTECGVGIEIESCPYWGMDCTRDHQNNGFCKLTGMNDWEDGSYIWESSEVLRHQ
ncbi:MAG: hypothetical protein M3Y24_11370 [Acidobacteriota bacterium]|nr:hypothetical protein [Acidobacteriota bacterium]